MGRFFMAGHNKRQDFMIDALRRIQSEHPVLKPELYLAGSIHKEPLDLDHFFKLQRSAGGLPVHFHPDVSVDSLQELYGQASIYWHATGWGVDVAREPYRMEHFGITTVEAMSAGCIPVVFDAGGQPEIVEHEQTGFLYRNVEDLMRFTARIMEGAAEPWVEDMRRKASGRSRDFSRQVFEKRIRELLDNLVTTGAQR
ncbi:MAG: glycosyltransferase, partial [Anaerolineales bacterium]|nr:glycosyltransferase [Anaerolineales bacterium]